MDRRTPLADDGCMTTTARLSTTDRPALTSRGNRTFLLADAALTGVNGLAYAAVSDPLAKLFGIDRGLLIWLGVFLLIVGLGVAVLATRTPIPRRGVALLAELNLVWVAASIGFAFIADLTTVGVVWTVLQAAIVLAFAVRQLQISRTR